MHLYNNTFHYPRHTSYIIFFNSSIGILGLSFFPFFHCQMSSDHHQSGKKRHQCSVCQKKFGRPSALLTHMYTHTGERPFKCHVYVYLYIVFYMIGLRCIYIHKLLAKDVGVISRFKATCVVISKSIRLVHPHDVGCQRKCDINFFKS